LARIQCSVKQQACGGKSDHAEQTANSCIYLFILKKKCIPCPESIVVSTLINVFGDK